MSNWIIRCANPRCRHVCVDSDWVFKPKKNPTEEDITLNVKQSHCPKCDCLSYYRATPKEIARLNLPSPRMEAAISAETLARFGIQRINT